MFFSILKKVKGKMKLIMKIIKYILYIIWGNIIASSLYGFKWGPRKGEEVSIKIDTLNKEIKDLLQKKIYNIRNSYFFYDGIYIYFFKFLKNG